MKENNENEIPKDEILVKKVEVDPINSDPSGEYLIDIKEDEKD